MGGIQLPLFGDLAGQGSIVAPTQIPNLNLWYDASVSNSAYMQTGGGSAPLNGQAVSQWIDKQGFGRNANQSAGTKQPLWQSAQQNGLGTLKFDGTNDFFSLNPIAWALSLSGQTTYIVFKALATTDQMYLSSTNTSGFAFYNNLGFWGAKTAGGAATSDAAISTTSYHYIGQIFDGTQTNVNVTTQNNLRLQVRFDGVQKTLTFSANVGTTTSGAANTLNVAADNAANNNFNGYIGEMLIWTRTLTSTEISQVEAYIKNKWGL